jgi:hypothetical protein
MADVLDGGRRDYGGPRILTTTLEILSYSHGGDVKGETKAEDDELVNE